MENINYPQTKIIVRKRMGLIILTFMPWLLFITFVVFRKYSFWLGLIVFLVGLATFYMISLANKAPVIIIDNVGMHVRPLAGTIRWVDILEVDARSYPRAGSVLVIKLKNGSTRKLAIQFLDLPLNDFMKIIHTQLNMVNKD